ARRVRANRLAPDVDLRAERPAHVGGDGDVPDARHVVEDDFVVGEERGDDLLGRGVLRAAGPNGASERRAALDPVAGHPGLRASGDYLSDDVDVAASARLAVNST